MCSCIEQLCDILLGFTVDFKADSNALDSIMNCKGIEHLPNTPAKSFSQFGPAKKPRTNLSQKSGRVVPFSRPSVVGRLKGKNMTESETNNDQMPSRASLLVSFVQCHRISRIFKSYSG